MANHRAVFDGRWTGWRFRRPSHQSTIDDGDVLRETGLNSMAIRGGIYDESTGNFVHALMTDPPDNSVVADNDAWEGLELRSEGTDETGTPAIVHAATNAVLNMGDHGLARSRAGCTGHIMYRTVGVPPPEGLTFLYVDPTGVAVVAYPDRIEVQYKSYANVHIPSTRLLDIRIRVSSSLTTWINGERVDTHGTGELPFAPSRLLAGETELTNSMGRLRYADWHDSARPFSEIEAWPSV